MEAKKIASGKGIEICYSIALGGGAVLNSYENKRRVCFGSFHSV